MKINMKKLFIYSLTIFLGFLFYWLLGFILSDISQWPGLRAESHMAPIQHSTLQQSQNRLSKQINQLQKQVTETKSQQNILEKNMQNTQSIIKQILDIQKLQAQHDLSNLSTLVITFKKNTDLFLNQQNQLQQFNQNIIQLNAQLLPLQNQYNLNSKKLNKLYSQAQEKYRFKIGLIQISVLLILLVLTSFIVRRKTASPYRLIWLALNISVAAKIFFVVHDYFPSRYFKYILVFALIIAVLLALVKLIKYQLSPNQKLYRLAYTKSLCGVCEFPIRAKENEIYFCPNCGTNLFEKCNACQQIKHSLLPYCEHCGFAESV